MEKHAITFQEIPVDLFESDPKHPRPYGAGEPGETARLADSILNLGLMDPIAVCPTGDGTYLIVDGLRRFRALKHIGWTTIPCFVHDLKDPADRYLLRWILQEEYKPWTAAEKKEVKRRIRVWEDAGRPTHSQEMAQKKKQRVA